MNKIIIAGLLATVATAVAPANAQSLLGGLRKKLEQAIERETGDVADRLTGGQADASTPTRLGAVGGYGRYGEFWEFRVEDVLQGPDGHWQAVIGVRNAASHRLGLTASEIKVYLITQDGEAIQNWGELYKASVAGPSLGLEQLPGTLWMEPGDEARVRVRWDKSRAIRPLKIRLQSTGASGESKSFPIR